MFSVSRERLHGVLLAAAVAVGGTGVQAATITTGALASGTRIDLAHVTPCGNSGGIATNVGSFTGSGPAGSGLSVCGDAASVQVKTPQSPAPFGRHNPHGGAWIDSNDLKRVTWNVDVGKAFTALSFALIDAHDQADSFFRIAVGGATWDISQREANGTVHWIRIAFAEATEDATITFSTRRNDGFGLGAVTVAPIPVPPAALLGISGAALLAAFGRRRPPAPNHLRPRGFSRRSAQHGRSSEGAPGVNRMRKVGKIPL